MGLVPLSFTPAKNLLVKRNEIFIVCANSLILAICINFSTLLFQMKKCDIFPKGIVPYASQYMNTKLYVGLIYYQYITMTSLCKSMRR